MQILEIWGKAQRESARRPESDLRVNLQGLKFPRSKVTWPEVKCISIRRTRIVDLGWVKIRVCNFFVSRPKFTNFLVKTSKDNGQSSLFPIFHIYLNRFLWYSRSNSKVVQNWAEFLTFCPPKFLGCRPLKICTKVIMPILRFVMWQSIVRLLPLPPKLWWWWWWWRTRTCWNLSQFRSPFEKKNCKRNPRLRWVCASKTWLFFSVCKNLGTHHPLRGRNIVFRNSRFGWV